MELPDRFANLGEQDMGEGVTVEWIDDGRIVIFRLNRPGKLTIDRWFEAVWQLFEEYPVDEPLILLHDTRQLGLVPYMREKSAMLSEKGARYTKGRYAVVMADTPLAQLGRLYVNFQARKVTTREGRAFTDFDAALEWLREDTS